MVKDPSDLRDALVSGVQMLGERADVKGLIPDAWQDGAITVMDHLTDSVQDARTRVSNLAKDSAQPLIGSDRTVVYKAAKDLRVQAAALLLIVSLLVLVRRRRRNEPRQPES